MSKSDTLGSEAIIDAFQEFLQRSSLLGKESMMNNHRERKEHYERFKQFKFLSSVLKELKYLDTKKGTELFTILTYDLVVQEDQKKNNQKRGDKSLELIVKNRANFIYLHSLFERMVSKLFRFGFESNQEFRSALKNQFVLRYEKLIENKERDEELRNALFEDQSKLPDQIKKLGYTPLYHLIELLGLRKGVFKDFIQISYEMDVYRVIRNSLTHRDGTLDESFFSEIDNIKGVRGRLGDVKNKKFKKEIFERILNLSIEDEFDNVDRTIEVSGMDLMVCLSYFIQIVSISIILISNDSKVINRLLGAFSSVLIHDLLHFHLETKSERTLFHIRHADTGFRYAIKLAHVTLLKRLGTNESIDSSSNLGDNVYYVNKVLLLDELLKQNNLGEESKNKLEVEKEKYLSSIDDELIQRITKDYLQYNNEGFIDGIKELLARDGDAEIEDWYMIKNRKAYLPVKSFISDYIEERRLKTMKTILADIRKFQKK